LLFFVRGVNTAAARALLPCGVTTAPAPSTLLPYGSNAAAARARYRGAKNGA